MPSRSRVVLTGVRAAGVCLLITFAPAAGFGQAPAVVWDIESEFVQLGFASNTPDDSSGAFIKSIDNGAGGFTAGDAAGAWELSLTAFSNTNPGQIDFTGSEISGVFSPNSISTSFSYATSWNDFSLSVASEAFVNATAWVRGEPGTPFTLQQDVSGSWSANNRQNAAGSTGATLSALGVTDTLDSPTDTDLMLDISETLNLVTTSETVTFDEFPGVVYSRAPLDRVLASASAEFERTVPGGDPTALVGFGALDGGIAISAGVSITLPGGAPPEAGEIVISDIAGEPGGRLLAAGVPTTFSSTSFDPDAGTTPGDGLLSYAWSAEQTFFGSPLIDETLLTDENAFTITSFVPGVVTVEVEVTDADGNTATQTEEFQTVNPDFNGDGVVDIADYEVWRDLFGSTGFFQPNANPDGNLDGVVNAADFTIWRDFLGLEIAPPSPVVAAPEPGSLVLVLAAGVLAAGRKRR